MDMSSLSDEDLEAISKGDFAKVSDAGLKLITEQGSPKEPSATDKVIANRPKSTYEGVPDDQLNPVQKAERWMVDHKLGITPGEEVFSPAHLDKTKYYAGLVGAAAPSMLKPGAMPAAAQAIGSAAEKTGSALLSAAESAKPYLKKAAPYFLGHVGGNTLGAITRKLFGRH